MTTEALRLADMLDRNLEHTVWLEDLAAAELRRLDAENKLLRKLLPEADGITYEPAPCVVSGSCHGCAVEDDTSVCEMMPDMCRPYYEDETKFIWLKVSPAAPSKLDAFANAPAVPTEGFTVWSGGACPVDGHAVVFARLRDGSTTNARYASHMGWGWSWRCPESDIVAYRVSPAAPAASGAQQPVKD